MAGDKNKLTEKQRQILEYLKQEILQRGFPPSVREICEAVSTSFYILGTCTSGNTGAERLYQTRCNKTESH